MHLFETIDPGTAERVEANARRWIENVSEDLQEGDEAVTDYDPVGRIDAIEHESRSGFWSWNSGGYEVCLPASLAHCWSTGYCPAPILPVMRSGDAIIADCWHDQHPDRPSLEDCLAASEGEPAFAWQEEAQDFESGAWQSDDDCYYWKARVIYYAKGATGNKSGEDEVYLDCYLCADSYGRDSVDWLPYVGGGKADQTTGDFKLTLPVAKFAAIRPEQVDRMVKAALRKLPSFVGCC